MHSPASVRSGGLCIPLFALVIWCTGCTGPVPAAQFVRQAQRLHEGLFAPAVVSDPDLRDYLQLVGKRLIAAGDAVEPGGARDPVFREMQFHLVACPVPNVFVTGGSHLYLCSGLFQYCRNEDELASALAPAYAHALNLDVEHLGIEPDPARPLLRVAFDFVTHRFTLAQERSADRLAFDLYVKAGYHPGQFASLFERLSNEFQVSSMPDRLSAAARLQESRIWAASASQGRRPLPVADPRTFAALHRQAAAVPPPPVNSAAGLVVRAFPNCMLPGDTPEQIQAQQQLTPPPPPPTRLEPS